jgi:hypothetical protein
MDVGRVLGLRGFYAVTLSPTIHLPSRAESRCGAQLMTTTTSVRISRLRHRKRSVLKRVTVPQGEIYRVVVEFRGSVCAVGLYAEDRGSAVFVSGPCTISCMRQLHLQRGSSAALVEGWVEAKSIAIYIDHTIT